MLNKKKVALLGAIAAVAMASTGAQAATETADAQVRIIAAVQLVEVNALNFGIVAPGAAAGIVTISTTSDTPTCDLGLSCVGTTTRGRFTVTGASGQTVAIAVDPTVTLNSGGNTMSVALTPSTTTVATTGSPVAFFVGGALSVGASQVAGNYVGTFTVTANYQ